MAVDPARDFIQKVVVRLNALTGGTYAEIVGNRAWSAHRTPPLVKWRFGAIEHQAPTEQGNIATERQALEVAVWAAGVSDDAADAATRSLKNSLLLACRQIAQETQIAPVEYGDFDWLDDEHSHLGRQLEGVITAQLQVPNQTIQTVVINTVENTTEATLDPDETVDVMTLT